TQKALLIGMLEPTNVLNEAEVMGDVTTRLALTEELKDFPFADIWNYNCQENHVPIGLDWLTEVQEYEKVILPTRQLPTGKD
ncbi:L-rhamnose isomerase, partial [Enterococcus faecalis]|uniref:L-rhamnose isomerase n=1 Tax=Enterococcus faecalis TaxID=1351 RepID=UPI003CC538A8